MNSLYTITTVFPMVKSTTAATIKQICFHKKKNVNNNGNNNNNKYNINLRFFLLVITPDTIFMKSSYNNSDDSRSNADATRTPVRVV